VSFFIVVIHGVGMMIQSDTHDSAEDARAALALYRKYEELKASGELEKALEDLYEVGKRIQWKVPGSDK
jgi:PAB-dependent poly(A)-specific ribonuclease subunit 2